MNDLALRCADVLAPIWVCMRDEMRVDPHVQADETSVRVSTIVGRSFIWTFLSKVHTVYVFSTSRSGDTPKEILGGTKGKLLVDAYTGYNAVTEVEGRDRSGCLCHARRYLFDALPTAPEARDGLDIILEIFMVEREAQAAGIVGTRAHLELRRAKSKPIVERLRVWRDKMTPLFEPGCPMADALRYMRNQWDRLCAFLADPLIPIHNNASEAALRIIALFRKNSLFFGNERAARRYMVIFSIIATCERHDINPEAYITDVLLRIKNTPADKMHELVPHRWKETHGNAFKVDRTVTPADAA